jgi:hypothetical protein
VKTCAPGRAFSQLQCGGRIGEEAQHATREFIGLIAECCGVVGLWNGPQGFWAGCGRINSFSVAARERRIFRVANQKNRKRPGGDGSFRRDVRRGKAGNGLTTRQHDPCSRGKKCFSQQWIFLESGVVVGSFANAGEGRFGNDRFDTRVDSGGLQRDSSAHGFSEGKGMSGVLGGYEFIENSARVVAFEPAVGCDRALTLTVRARVHHRDAVAGAKKKARVHEDPHAIIRDAVEEQDPGAIWMCRANFPTAKKRAVGRSDVERFASNAELAEGDIGLLDEVGRECAANGVEKSRSDEPAKNDGDERRGEKQGEENPEKESHL